MVWAVVLLLLQHKSSIHSRRSNVALQQGCCFCPMGGRDQRSGSSALCVSGFLLQQLLLIVNKLLRPFETPHGPIFGGCGSVGASSPSQTPCYPPSAQQRGSSGRGSRALLTLRAKARVLFSSGRKRCVSLRRKSLDLVESLLRLSEVGQYEQVKQLFGFPIKHCPDMLVLALLQISTSWHTLRHELISTLMPIFLGNHPNSAIILHYAWHGQVPRAPARRLVLRSSF